MFENSPSPVWAMSTAETGGGGYFQEDTVSILCTLSSYK
jgi:hypothetical protein